MIIYGRCYRGGGGGISTENNTKTDGMQITSSLLPFHAIIILILTPQ